MITKNKSSDSNSTAIDDDIQQTLNKNKLMNIEILKDQNITEYNHKMQEYNASLLSQKKHKLD